MFYSLTPKAKIVGAYIPHRGSVSEKELEETIEAISWWLRSDYEIFSNGVRFTFFDLWNVPNGVLFAGFGTYIIFDGDGYKVLLDKEVENLYYIATLEA